MAAEQTFEVSPRRLDAFEARFGDKDGALALLEFPSQRRDFFLRLSNRADLPDSAPAGAAWEPFVRGWPQDDYYLVALTEPDHTAARPGMIATRMIAVALTEAEKWDDLGAAFEILHETNRPYVPELSIPPRPTKTPQQVPPALLACVADHLIHEDKPAAIIGQEGFEDLITAVWQKMPPELRRAFTFGFSFTPADLSVMRTNIVAVPLSCGGRWSGYNFKCDATWNKPLEDSIAAFLSDAQAREFLGFLRDVGLAFHSFSDYGRYSRLWNYWQTRNENDLEVILALLRSLGTLLPSPDQAADRKEEAMRIATRLLTAGTEENILALRSIKAPSFPSNGTVLGGAVSSWLKSHFQSSQPANATAISKVVRALPASHSPDWQQWVRRGLRQEFASLDERSARTIWLVWQQEETLAEIGGQLPTDATTEEVLIRTCPTSIPAKLFSMLEKWCVSRGWICLTAKAALSHLGFAKAIDLVFKHNGGKPRTAAIELLCAAAKLPEVWLSAFRHNDPTLVKCAVAAARMDPALWSGVTSDNNRWVELLESAARADRRFLCGINPPNITVRICEALGSGIPLSEVACEALEQAGKLEFTHCTNRYRLWSILPERHLAKSLSNTIRSWLKDYYSRPPTPPNLEKELSEILFAPEHRDLVFPQSNQHLALGGLMLVEAFGKERDCVSWLHAIMAGSIELSPVVAARAGQLVTQRHWVNVAKAAKHHDEMNNRSDVRPIWHAYYDSLGRLEKFFFDYFPGSPRSSFGFSTITNPNPMMDAVFVTALPEEFSAVCAHLFDRREHTEGGTIYEIGRFDCDGTHCTVAVVQTGMGNVLSAAATERVLNLFKPSFAFFVGIAGGLRDDLKIGDVVAASKVYGYEGGKSGVSFMPRPDAPSVSYEAEQRANAVVRDKAWQKRIVPVPRSAPHAVVRPIAAGEKVLVSETSEELKRVRAIYTDAHAVAMEDHGFATATRAHPNVCFAVVRGISDLIENKQEADHSGSHEIAARNAAAFAFEMLVGLLRGREISRQDEAEFLD